MADIRQAPAWLLWQLHHGLLRPALPPKKFPHAHDLAEQACSIELDMLKEPIGKQDQYIASCGGLTCFTFEKNGKSWSSPENFQDSYDALEDNLLLFFTGYSRSPAIS